MRVRGVGHRPNVEASKAYAMLHPKNQVELAGVAQVRTAVEDFC